MLLAWRAVPGFAAAWECQQSQQGPAANDVRDVYAFLSMLAMFCYFTLLVDFSTLLQIALCATLSPSRLNMLLAPLAKAHFSSAALPSS